jgi:hypothetical protein
MRAEHRLGRTIRAFDAAIRARHDDRLAQLVEKPG